MASSSLPWAAHLISALADGITPSVFLSAQESKGPEYCFSVPEAFSRLVLEHKVRPSARLAAIFLTSLHPRAVGGLGSLLLRLSQDGHAHLEVVGPPGTAQFMHSLRHLYFWRHPKVFVTELGRSDSGAVYSDLHLTVFSLRVGGEALPCPHCLPLFPDDTATSPLPSSSPRADTGVESSASSSEEDESEGEPPPATDTGPAVGANTEVTPGSATSPCEAALESTTFLLFDEFDTLFTTKTEARRLKKAFLRKVNGAPTFRRRQLSVPGKINGDRQSEGDQMSHPEPALPHHPAQPLPNPSPHPLPPAPMNPPLSTPQAYAHQSESSAATDTFECCPYKRRGGTDCPPFSAPPSDSQLPLLPPGANPIYLRLGSSILPLNSAGFQGGRGEEASLLGYFCYLKAERKAFLLMDCETANQIRELKRITATWHSQKDPLPCLGAVLHITSPSFAQSPPYSSLIKSFHPTLLQVGVGVGPPELGFLSSLRLSQTLNTVSPLHFPLPSAGPAHPPLPPLPTHLSAGKLLMKVVFGDKDAQNWRLESTLPPAPPPLLASPPTSSRGSEVATAVLKEGGEEGDAPPPAAAAAAAAVSKLSANQNTAKALRCLLKGGSTRTAPDPFEVLFLGTGSAEPSKYRASTGILLTLRPSPGMETFMLLDAGVGTLGQLKRCLGLEQAGRVVGRLGCVWVSHRHADHAGGVMAVLAARGEGAEPVAIVGPAALEEALRESAAAMRVAGEKVPPYRFLRCSQLGGRGGPPHRGAPGSTLQERIVEKLQLRSLQSVAVDHCRDAWGIVIRGYPDWSIAFSGDTRPCSSMVAAARGCTLLIHEATYEDQEELRQLAVRNRHSTVEEALGVGEACGAHRVLLTHFSQRHPKAVAVDPGRCSRACVTFDGMRVAHSQLEGLPLLMTRLMAALEAGEEDGEKRGGVAGEEGPGGDLEVLSAKVEVEKEVEVEEVRGKGLQLEACCGEEESDDKEREGEGAEREEKGMKRTSEKVDEGNARKHVRFLDSDSSGEEVG